MQTQLNKPTYPTANLKPLTSNHKSSNLKLNTQLILNLTHLTPKRTSTLKPQASNPQAQRPTRLNLIQLDPTLKLQASTLKAKVSKPNSSSTQLNPMSFNSNHKPHTLNLRTENPKAQHLISFCLKSPKVNSTEFNST